MGADPEPPRLVVADRVHTMMGAAEAVLVRGGRVAATGSYDRLREIAPGAEAVDLRGTTVTPGLADAHVHLVEWALSVRGVDLASTSSPEEAAQRVAQHAQGGAERTGAGGWFRGRGWDPHRWERPPHRELLDRLLPDRPVLLQSHDMHSFWANGAALEAAGIGTDTPDPPGGRIERDPDGRPTGVVRENAMPLLLRAAPVPGVEERRQAVLEAQGRLHQWGVTGVHTVEPDSLGLLEMLRHQDVLRLRVLQHLPLAKLEEAITLGVRSGFGGEWLRVGGVKMFLDGALGSRTAWLREPYEGEETYRGVSTLPEDEFREAVRSGSAAGLATTVHAIGDAAMDLALDVLAEEGGRLEGPVPHRIEHAQLVAESRLADAGAARVVCSVQPSHMMTDWPAVDRHWGRRGRRAYAFRSLLRGGAVLALGSDAPVEPPDPRQGLHAATTRTDLDGAPAGGWYAEERLTVRECLAGYTLGPARAAGDPRQGRLAPGSFADLVAWDRDPLETDADSLLELRCLMTMVGGDVVWRDR